MCVGAVEGDLLLWLSQVKQLECCYIQPSHRVGYGVCTCTVWLGCGLLYHSLLDSVLIMDFNNIATYPRNDLSVLGHVYGDPTFWV